MGVLHCAAALRLHWLDQLLVRPVAGLVVTRHSWAAENMRDVLSFAIISEEPHVAW